MAQILNGKTLSQEIKQELASNISALEPKPYLAVLLVGNDPASHLYVSLKEKACLDVGIRFSKYEYPEHVDEQVLIDHIYELNQDEDVNGILVQLPLPNQNADRVIEAIDPKKDVDGFHPQNLQKLLSGEQTLVPAVALGIMKLLEVSPNFAHAKKATLVSSDLFAKPFQVLLAEHKIDSSVTKPGDQTFLEQVKEADVLIVAIGKPQFIKAEHIKPGAILIDVGTTKVEGKLYGDIDQASVEPVAKALSPVPGGAGPMTVAMLLQNVLSAYHQQKNRP